jgi:hypothetical protein
MRRPELQLETCLGLPDQKLTKGKTTLFTYNANSASNLSLSVPVVNGVSVAFAGYCHATFRLESGRVTEIHYSGQTDDMGNKRRCLRSHHPILRGGISGRARSLPRA